MSVTCDRDCDISLVFFLFHLLIQLYFSGVINLQLSVLVPKGNLKNFFLFGFICNGALLTHFFKL